MTKELYFDPSRSATLYVKNPIIYDKNYISNDNNSELMTTKESKVTMYQNLMIKITKIKILVRRFME